MPSVPKAKASATARSIRTGTYSFNCMAARLGMTFGSGKVKYFEKSQTTTRIPASVPCGEKESGSRDARLPETDNGKRTEPGRSGYRSETPPDFLLRGTRHPVAE